MSNAKISIRFFEDREVRAVWDQENAKWWFSVLDIVALLTDQDDYPKTRNYWKYLKAKLKKENSQVVSVTTQLKLLAPDGKKRLTDMLDYSGIIALGKEFPGKKANRFIEWFTFSDESIDGKSKSKAYALYDSSFVDSIEIGTAISNAFIRQRRPAILPCSQHNVKSCEYIIQGLLDRGIAVLININ
jgi:cell filamentation protein